MTARTRHFIVASLAVLGLGLGAGSIAYLTGAAAFTAAPGPDEMRFVPKDATLVAFANVQEVMTSDLRQKMRDGGLLPGRGAGTLQGETGINPETDIDRVVLGSVPGDGPAGPASDGVLLARGRFDAVRIERAMRDRGARVEEYKGVRIITAPRRADPRPDGRGPGGQPAASPTLALAFLEPGLIAFGEEGQVRRAVDTGRGGESVLANDQLITRIRPVEGQTLWAVGRLEGLPTERVTGGMLGQLPPISWFTASGRIDAGVKAHVTAETLDEAAANGLRDVVRGLMAIGRMQAGSRPELQALIQSVQIGGSGQAVTLSFDLSPQTLDMLANGLRPPAGPRP
ncbi:MAG: hypothetical protein AB7O32_12710 [Vicinamibacterales bacterium]